MTVKYTRKQYMAGECTHEQYYGQFVTPAVIQTVLQKIDEAQIKRSTDPAFNDIPLYKWDWLHSHIGTLVGRALMEANGGIGYSLSDTVCVAKAAARMIKEEETS